MEPLAFWEACVGGRTNGGGKVSIKILTISRKKRVGKVKEGRNKRS